MRVANSRGAPVLSTLILFGLILIRRMLQVCRRRSKEKKRRLFNILDGACVYRHFSQAQLPCG